MRWGRGGSGRGRILGGRSEGEPNQGAYYGIQGLYPTGVWRVVSSQVGGYDGRWGIRTPSAYTEVYCDRIALRPGRPRNVTRAKEAHALTNTLNEWPILLIEQVSPIMALPGSILRASEVQVCIPSDTEISARVLESGADGCTHL